jgi:two-component system chemotaxis response regulator CheB
MQLWRGPKENFHRPAVNALFHSAAVTYGKRVVGILLTGNSEDGSAGLWWIKRFGGLAIVQENAAYPKMPNSALEYTKVDYVVPISAMPPLLKTLVNNGSRLDVEPERQQGERPWKRKRS